MDIPTDDHEVHDDSKENKTPTLTLEQVTQHNRLADELLGDAKFEVSGAWEQLPRWLDHDELPFNTAECFANDSVRNGGQDYLRAVARSSVFDALSLLPEFQKELEAQELHEQQQPQDETNKSQNKEYYDLAKNLGDVRYRLLDWVYHPEDEEDSSYFDQQAPIYLESLGGAINDLKAGNQCQQVFIPEDFSLDGTSPSNGFREIARDLSIICRVKDLDHALQAVELTFEVDRHLRKLGCEIRQLVSSAILRMAISDQVAFILKARPNQIQLQKLIAILSQAHRWEVENPRDLELAKFEHLQLRKLFHDLQSDSFEPDPDTLEYYSISKDLPDIVIVHQLMSSIYLGGYPANDDVAIETIEELFGKDSDEVTKAKEAIKETNESPLTAGISAGMIIPKVVASYQQMSDSDFEFEVKVLNQRYAEIEAAIHLSYPQRIDAMEVLRKQWTRDDRWKEMKFLKWYYPKSYTGKLSARNRLLIDGTLSLACIRLFKLNNDGQLPNDVKEALVAAGIENPGEIIDPYSGQPFKLLDSGTSSPQIYSLGPDRKDNAGHPPLEAANYPPDAEGDVVFELSD